LRSLTSAAGLMLPETIGKSVYVKSLSVDKKELLKKQYPKLRFA
jgi:hypothetical protein